MDWIVITDLPCTEYSFDKAHQARSNYTTTLTRSNTVMTEHMAQVTRSKLTLMEVLMRVFGIEYGWICEGFWWCTGKF